jgi:hypothetical protein
MTDHAHVAFFAVRRRMNRDPVRGVMRPLGLCREPGNTRTAIPFDKRNAGGLQTCSR